GPGPYGTLSRGGPVMDGRADHVDGRAGTPARTEHRDRPGGMDDAGAPGCPRAPPHMGAGGPSRRTAPSARAGPDARTDRPVGDPFRNAMMTQRPPPLSTFIAADAAPYHRMCRRPVPHPLPSRAGVVPAAGFEA